LFLDKYSRLFSFALRPGWTLLTFFCYHQKKGNKEKSPLLPSTGSGSGLVVELVETTGNSALRASNSPQFLTLIPRFSKRNFHEAVYLLCNRSKKSKAKKIQ